MKIECDGREYRPFVEACRERGIGKTKAYELDAEGLVETFPIGRKRYVFIDSLLTLPQRLAEREAEAQRGARVAHDAQEREALADKRGKAA